MGGGNQLPAGNLSARLLVGKRGDGPRDAYKNTEMKSMYIRMIHRSA